MDITNKLINSTLFADKKLKFILNVKSYNRGRFWIGQRSQRAETLETPKSSLFSCEVDFPSGGLHGGENEEHFQLTPPGDPDHRK